MRVRRRRNGPRSERYAAAVIRGPCPLGGAGAPQVSHRARCARALQSAGTVSSPDARVGRRHSYDCCTQRPTFTHRVSLFLSSYTHTHYLQSIIHTRNVFFIFRFLIIIFFFVSLFSTIFLHTFLFLPFSSLFQFFFFRSIRNVASDFYFSISDSIFRVRFFFFVFCFLVEYFSRPPTHPPPPSAVTIRTFRERTHTSPRATTPACYCCTPAAVARSIGGDHR